MVNLLIGTDNVLWAGCNALKAANLKLNPEWGDQLKRGITHTLGKCSARGHGAVLPRCEGGQQGAVSLPGLAGHSSCCWRLSCGLARVTKASHAPCEKGKLPQWPEESSWTSSEQKQFLLNTAGGACRVGMALTRDWSHQRLVLPTPCLNGFFGADTSLSRTARKDLRSHPFFFSFPSQSAGMKTLLLHPVDVGLQEQSSRS